MQDVSTKNYVDALGVPKFVVMTGMLHTIMLVDIVTYTLPANKTVLNNKISVGGIWVERNSGE